MGPPKGSHPGGGSAFGNDGEEDILQVVVIADSFNERFMPITLDKPRCLLPLLNVPIIEYTFEFLAISGVQEVILLCRAHSDQIKHYIARSRWAKPTSTMHIQIVVAPESMSVGDGLREVDNRGLIHGDFILVSGDVVSNMSLARALEVHRKTRAQDKNVIMTMVLKRASPCHRSREHCEGAIFAIDAGTKECLAYEPVDTELYTRKISIDAKKIAEHAEMNIRYDLMDCQIDICSLNVLALFTENFDYQDMRKDFVRGVLTSDILGYKISTHILREEYAARVRTPRLYASISRDLIARWMFPIVPESNLLEDQPLAFRRGYQYIGSDTVFSQTAEIGEYVVIGASVTVGEGSRIRNTVIGPNCQIGPDVVLEGAFLGEGCLIEAGAKVYSSILAENVLVKAGSLIERGCLVTSNVTLGPRAALPPFTRVAKLNEHIDVQLDNLSLAASPHDGINRMTSAERLRILGLESDGVVWEGTIEMPEEEEAFDEDENIKEERRKAFALDSNFKLHFTYDPPEPSSDESDDVSEDDLHGATSEGDLEDDDPGSYSDGDGSSVGAPNHNQFTQEAEELVKHALDSNYSVDNAALELNGLKFACNATFKDCQSAILEALFSRCDAADLAKSVSKLWTRWGPLLTKFTHGAHEQAELIAMVCTLCRTHGRPHGSTGSGPFERAFTLCIPLLYKTDVLDDDSIIAWYAAESAAAGEDSLYCRQIRNFVAWLEAEDSDGNDEDDDSSMGDLESGSASSL